MLRDQRSLWRWLMALGVISVFLQAPGLRAQDEPAGEEEEEEAPDIRLRGWTGLKVPEGSEDEDARGWSVVYQRGSRQALHVYVRGLEPGASYSVSASQGDESESIGSITTRDAEVSAPRCFRTGLRVPAGGDEGGGDEGGGDEGGGGAHWSRDRDRGPRGGASVFVNEDGTAARYGVWVRGLDGDVAGARIVLGDGAALELDAAELSGSGELGEGQRDQLASAIVEILTAAEGEEPAVALAGDLEQCASDEWRERRAARRAGRGAMRLDTDRGDAMPFGVESIAALEGAIISIADGDGNVVLAGDYDEIVELAPPRWRRRHDSDDDDDDDDNDEGGGGAAVDDLDEDVDPSPFAVPETHDASFLRGDATDDGRVDVSDPVQILFFLFGGASPGYCPDAMDADDNGAVTIADPIRLLQSLFQQGEPLEPKGFDRSVDTLSCASYES